MLLETFFKETIPNRGNQSAQFSKFWFSILGKYSECMLAFFKCVGSEFLQEKNSVYYSAQVILANL